MTETPAQGPFDSEQTPAWQAPRAWPSPPTTQGSQLVKPSRRWPVGVTIAIVCVLGLGGCIGSLVLYAYTSGRAHESFRRAEQFDDSTVRNRADEVCAALFTATDKLALAEFAVVSDRVAAENEAIGDLIRDFGDLDQSVLTDDKPALQWLGDWKSLVTRRTEYAAALRDDPLARRPALPLTDGYPISRRMSSLHDGCAVPISVLDDFEISPFRDLEECTYAIELHICATPDGAVFIDGLTPHSEAEVWVRFGDAVSRSTQTADSVGRIELIGVRLGNGTVVAVDAVIEEFRGVVMAA